MALTGLSGANLDAPASLADGQFYCNSDCLGMPRYQSAGYFSQETYNDGSDDILVVQTFKGLLNYGDRVLATYERFIFPKEIADGKRAAGPSWAKREAGTYKIGY